MSDEMGALPETTHDGLSREAVSRTRENPNGERATHPRIIETIATGDYSPAAVCVSDCLFRVNLRSMGPANEEEKGF